MAPLAQQHVNQIIEAAVTSLDLLHDSLDQFKTLQTPSTPELIEETAGTIVEVTTGVAHLVLTQMNLLVSSQVDNVLERLNLGMMQPKTSESNVHSGTPATLLNQPDHFNFYHQMPSMMNLDPDSSEDFPLVEEDGDDE